MGTFTSKATGQWEAEGQTTWNEAGHPVAGDDVTIQSGHTISLVQHEACKDNTVDVGGVLSVSTYNLINSGDVDINGTLNVGTSADRGFVVGGNYDATGATINTEVGGNSKFEFVGDAIWKNASNKRCYITKTGDGTFLSAYGDRPYSFKIDVGATFTAPSDTYLVAGGDFINNGTIACSTHVVNIAPGAGKTVEFGASSNITGSGQINWGCFASNVTVSNSAAMDFTGVWEINRDAGIGGTVFYQPNLNLKNATVNLYGDSSSASEIIPIGGIHSANDLNFGNEDNQNVELSNDTNNPSFEIYGNYNLHAGGGAFTGTITKGTGSITSKAVSGTKTWALDGQSVEDIIHDHNAAATIQYTEVCTTDSLTGTVGIIDHNGQDMTTIGGYTLTSNANIVAAGLNGMTLTVGGNYLVAGSIGDKLDLKATAGWTLTITGTAGANYVDVAHSDASGGTEVTATNSTDSSNNTNWDFGSAPTSGLYRMKLSFAKQLQINI